MKAKESPGFINEYFLNSWARCKPKTPEYEAVFLNILRPDLVTTT
jgi:hypothetical protein